MIEADRNPRRARRVARGAPAVAGERQISDGNETPRSEYRELRATIQELRRKTTIMAAELFEMDEIRASRDEASLRLEEARSKILASNNRRKEMARVIANRNAKIEALNRANELRQTEIADRNAKIEALNRANELRNIGFEKVSAEYRSRELKLQARCEELEAQAQDAKSKLKTSHARRKEMALLIAKRGSTIASLQSQLESAHERIATLERHVRSSVTWWLRKFVR